MEKKIAIIGSGHVGDDKQALIEKTIKENPDVIIIDNGVAINGENKGKTIHEIMELDRSTPFKSYHHHAVELGDKYAGIKPVRARKLSEKINVYKEYHLIQEKKSTLSRWERDEVVRLYNENH